MAGLRIALLGGLEIAGGEITARASLTRKTRALVAYLALQGARGQSREKPPNCSGATAPRNRRAPICARRYRRSGRR